jgi:hypothetical protein
MLPVPLSLCPRRLLPLLVPTFLSLPPTLLPARMPTLRSSKPAAGTQSECATGMSAESTARRRPSEPSIRTFPESAERMLHKGSVWRRTAESVVAESPARRLPAPVPARWSPGSLSRVPPPPEGLTAPATWMIVRVGPDTSPELRLLLLRKCALVFVITAFAFAFDFRLRLRRRPGPSTEAGTRSPTPATRSRLVGGRCLRCGLIPLSWLCVCAHCTLQMRFRSEGCKCGD